MFLGLFSDQFVICCESCLHYSDFLSFYWDHDCRFPCGSQGCDTVVGISVDGMSAAPIQHRFGPGNCVREPDSGENPDPPKVNHRPPWGGQESDIVVGFSACVMIRGVCTLLCPPPPLRPPSPRPPPPPANTAGKAGAALLPDAPRPQIHPEIFIWQKNQK